MPRKQNGFGNPKSLGFKGAGRVDKGKGVGAPGTYPSNRGYGSSVTRTVIEKYNLDSDWTKWRKGYEYSTKLFGIVCKTWTTFLENIKTHKSNPNYIKVRRTKLM